MFKGIYFRNLEETCEKLLVNSLLETSLCKSIKCRKNLIVRLILNLTLSIKYIFVVDVISRYWMIKKLAKYFLISIGIFKITVSLCMKEHKGNIYSLI